MMMRSLADRDEAMDKFVAACRFLALIVGDGLSIDRQWLAFFQELSASGKLRWICGTAAELARLGLFHPHGVHPKLCSVEIVATQGTDAVLVWDPGAKRIVTLEVPVVTSVTGDDIGAGDAYAGGYLHSRILNRSIKDAHAVAATCAKRVLKVSGARVEAESDLNRVFGHLTDRASEAHDEGKLYDRVRITPGITVISGGQTGVDQIGLCAATQLGLPAFGVLPQGRRTEVTEGIIAGPDDFCDSYIVELRSASYRFRTLVTAFLADGTLIWDFHGSEGSAATRTACQTLGRPLLDLAAAESSSLLPEVIRWADRHAIRVLNIAGNRGSLISGREHTHVETDLNSILKSLAWRRAQRSTTGQPRQRPEPATGTGKVGAAGYSGLRIGFPNVPPQLALLGQFLLETAGVRLPQSRRLVIPIDELKITFALARPRDLPAMLRDRLIDLIFCGADLLAEDQIDASILLDTGLFPCFLALVGRPAQAPGGAQPRSLRVGSQYPLLAPRLLSEIGLEPDIRVFHGTAETWINLNAIDAAVDTWRTGATANANGLDLITVFRETAFVAAFLPSQTGLIDARSAAFVARFQEWLVGQHAGDDARVTAIRP